MTPVSSHKLSFYRNDELHATIDTDGSVRNCEGGILGYINDDSAGDKYVYDSME